MSVERTILTIAGRQLGLVTKLQLFSAGVTRGQTYGRVANGLLVRVFPSVYRLASTPTTLDQTALAGCLVAGPGAFVSHATAAKLLDLLPSDHVPIEVTAPVGRRVRLPRLIVYRSRVVSPREYFRRGPLTLSTAARAVIDLAGVMVRDELESVVDRAIGRKLLTARGLFAESSRAEFGNRRSIATVKTIARARFGDGIAESELEVRMAQLVRRFGLPAPVRQYETIAGSRRVRFDLAYPHQRLAIELDGLGPHATRDIWQRDHERHNATELVRWRTLRFTWWDVTERPMYVAMVVAEALGIRPTRWTSPVRTV